MTQEVWKDIAGWEGTYQVSDLGRVRSVTRVIPGSRPGQKTRTMQGRILSTAPGKHGYRQAVFTAPGRRETVYVHHLVLAAFVGPRPDWCEEIRHLNGVKADCALANLEYGTCQQNAADRKTHGQEGNRTKPTKLTPEQIVDCQLLSLTMSNRQLAQKFGVSHTTMNGYLS